MDVKNRALVKSIHLGPVLSAISLGRGSGFNYLLGNYSGARDIVTVVRVSRTQKVPDYTGVVNRIRRAPSWELWRISIIYFT